MAGNPCPSGVEEDGGVGARLKETSQEVCGVRSAARTPSSVVRVVWPLQLRMCGLIGSFRTASLILFCFTPFVSGPGGKTLRVGQDAASVLCQAFLFLLGSRKKYSNTNFGLVGNHPQSVGTSYGPVVSTACLFILTQSCLCRRPFRPFNVGSMAHAPSSIFVPRPTSQVLELRRDWFGA